jgi:putative IMPACT (imprinted ancient) family translation regulator
MDSDYSTVKDSAEASFTEKKSEFIGHIKQRKMKRWASSTIYAQPAEKPDIMYMLISYVQETFPDIPTTANLRVRREFLCWRYSARKD